MISLTILGIFTAYVAVAVFSTTVAIRIARAKGLSSTRYRTYGGMVALVFFLIPFWDWIPTEAAFRYYCATEAKFEAFKSAERWKKENAEILPTLRYDPKALITQVDDYRRFPLNARIATEHRTTDVFLSVKREESRLVDLKSRETLARYTDFRSGYGSFMSGGSGTWKFWLKHGFCDDIGKTPASLYGDFTGEYEFGRAKTYGAGKTN